ncbi:MAG: glycosyltransferase family 9 protein [Nitrospirae bacterium]|nr:glycosyltransferase family 9 protein [Nitrospirota bacterium]
MKPGNIFIHHDGALGDMLLSLPCIQIIREFAAQIHLAGRRDVVHFLKEAGIVDEISSADSLRYSSLYSESLDDSMKSFLSGFYRSFFFTANTESALLHTIRRIIPATRAIQTIPPDNIPEHAAEFRVKQCGFGRIEAQQKVLVRISDKEKVWAAEFLNGRGYAAAGHGLFIVHPGSGGKKKCWPLEEYAELIALVMSNPSLFCLLLSGPAEDAETVRMLEQLARTGRRIVHLHDVPLIRVAALLERSRFYIGNDSGISHLAGIMHCRGVVLFGPTDPRVWKPTGGTLEVLKFDDETDGIGGQIQIRMKRSLDAC